MNRKYLQKLLEDGSCEKALPRILHMRREDPRDRGLAMMEGICRTDLGDYAGAVIAMESVLEDVPEFLDAQAYFAFSLARLGRVNQSERVARKLLLHPKTSAFALIKTAEGLTHRRTGLARQLLRAAMRIDHEDSLTWVAWSLMLSLAGRMTAAQSALNQALKLSPKNPSILEMAFWYALHAGRPALALSHAVRIPLGHFQSCDAVNAVLLIASENLPVGDPYLGGLKRRLRALRRSPAGQAQAVIDAVTGGKG